MKNTNVNLLPTTSTKVENQSNGYENLGGLSHLSSNRLLHIDSKLSMDLIPMRYESTSTNPYLHAFEENIWKKESVINPSSTLNLLHTFEARYNLLTKKFIQAYRNFNLHMLNNIDPDDVEKWADLARLRGKYY